MTNCFVLFWKNKVVGNHWNDDIFYATKRKVNWNVPTCQVEFNDNNFQIMTFTWRVGTNPHHCACSCLWNTFIPVLCNTAPALNQPYDNVRSALWYKRYDCYFKKLHAFCRISQNVKNINSVVVTGNHVA